MNNSKQVAPSGRIRNAVKAGAASGFVLTWIVSCPNYIPFLALANPGDYFAAPFLAGLLLSLAVMAFKKIRHHFMRMPWHYISLSAVLLLFARLFTADSLYFGISSFLLGICAFYILNHLAVLFMISEEPVCLTGAALLVAILFTFLANTFISFRPEHGGLLSFALSFSIPVFFLATIKQRKADFHPHEYSETFFNLRFDRGVLKYLLLLLFCFITVFMIYLLSSFYLNCFMTLKYGYGLYAATYLLYLAAVVFFTYIVRRYNPPYGLGYCVCVFACAVALAAAAFNNEWIQYLYFFLYSVAAAGADFFTFLIVVFLARQTMRSVYFILGATFYWLIIELSSMLGVSAMPLYDTRLISLLTVVVILLAFPFLASRHMILPLCNVQDASKGKEKASDEQPFEGKEMCIKLPLTAAEKKVYDLVCRGLSNADIASELSISTNTVKFHVRNILQKANVKNRFELVTSRYTASTQK